MAKAMTKGHYPKKDEAPKYVMPEVEVGDAVLWHDGYGAPPTGMALVTRCGADNITVAVLGEGYQNFIVKTGVRHYSHPDKQLIEQTDSGVWSHRPGWLKILDRLEQVEAAYTDLYSDLGVPAGGSKLAPAAPPT
jgi:hypothetical protein